MGYFILVEKDSSKMQKCWKWIIIGLLIVIVATCFTTSYGFQALQRNFNSNCMSSATIILKRSAIRNDAISQRNNINRSNSSEENAKKVNELLKEFNSFYRSETSEETDEITSAHLYEYLNNGPTIFRTTTERSNLTVEEKDLLNSKDADFFKNYQIDEMSTLWGDQGTCAYFYYVPVVETICAVVWIVFIAISGHRGEQVAKSFIHKSWRLVVPAIVCFTILAILSAAYAIVLNSRLDDFCNEFTSKFNNKDLSCQLMLNRFSLDDDTAWSPATNFNLCKLLSWLTVVLWLVAVLVMLARCILGADFNIEEIENYTEAYGTEVDPETERVDTKVKFNDAVRRYSRERIYRPTTTDRVEDK